MTSAATGAGAAPAQQTSSYDLAEAEAARGAPIPLSTPAVEACPLCATPLGPDQDWCLRCGAAARTRLAATPNWKAPILTALVIAVLALGVLAAALVKLAGGTSTAAAVTTTITAAGLAPAATAPAATTSAATAPAATSPATGTTPGAAATTTTPGVAGAQGPATVTTTPGVSSSPTVTTLTPAEREAERQAASPLSSR